MTRRERLQQCARRMDARTISDAVAAAKRGGSEGRLQLTAVMAWAAYSCPGATEAVCDSIASARFDPSKGAMSEDQKRVEVAQFSEDLKSWKLESDKIRLILLSYY